MNNSYEYYQVSAEYILDKIGVVPKIGLILGSGLGAVADIIENKVVIPYSEIPNFLVSTAPTHAGELLIGTLSEKTVVCMSGRFHYYEGYAFEQLSAPIRLFKLLGVETTLITNASGGVNTTYKPGDIMIVKDHINLIGASPMRGKNIDEFGPRFFSVENMYTKTLREMAKKCAQNISLTVHEGIYMFMPGPHFETPAEISAARILGADAVGMSTVTEALTAAHCGMPLLCLSLITNMAAGIENKALSLQEVQETADLVSNEFSKYVIDLVHQL